MARRKRKSSAVIAIVLVIILIAVFVGGWYLYTYQRPIFDEIYNTILGKKDNETPGEPDKPPVIVDGDLSIHFLELGNNYTGDCIYIKAGDTDVLVDAGSRAGSVDTIQTYLKDYVKDDILEYVVVTHADQDHIAGFGASKSIFDLYECQTIIQFAKTNKSEYDDEEKGGKTLYKKYLEKRDAEVAAGAACYTALECCREMNGAKKTYQLSDEVTMNILYQEFYENSSSDENNYSVCFLLTHGDRNFLLTGDLEKKGEESLVKNNKLPRVELFKAGHHGSYTSSSDALLSVIQPKIVCVCCCAGSIERKTAFERLFPAQDFINRVAVYTNRVYVTSMRDLILKDGKHENVGDFKSMNGNIVVSSGKEGVTVNCSNNDLVLKDTEWFKANRTLPDAWKTAA